MFGAWLSQGYFPTHTQSRAVAFVCLMRLKGLPSTMLRLATREMFRYPRISCTQQSHDTMPSQAQQRAINRQPSSNQRPSSSQEPMSNQRSLLNHVNVSPSTNDQQQFGTTNSPPRETSNQAVATTSSTNTRPPRSPGIREQYHQSHRERHQQLLRNAQEGMESTLGPGHSSDEANES